MLNYANKVNLAFDDIVNKEKINKITESYSRTNFQNIKASKNERVSYMAQNNEKKFYLYIKLIIKLK